MTSTLLFHAQVQISQVALLSAPRLWQVKVSARGSSTFIPRGLCSQPTFVRRWEHRPISCVWDERLLWLESSPGPCGRWEVWIMVTLGISRPKASEASPLENSQGTRMRNSALSQQFLQPTMLLWASNFISLSLTFLICKTRVPISRGGWKDSVR